MPVASTDLSAAAWSLVAFGAFLLVGGFTPLALLWQQRARRSRPRRNPVDLGLRGLLALVTTLLAIALFTHLSWEKRLYVEPAHEVRLTERTLLGEQVESRVEASEVRRVIFHRWATSGAKNSTRQGATIVFESTAHPRAVAFETTPGAEPLAQDLARRLEVPFARIP